MTAVTRPALVLAHASPRAVVLPGVQREGQALPPDGVAGADRLGLRDLIKGGARRGDREEQFRVGMPACGQLPPVPLDAGAAATRISDDVSRETDSLLKAPPTSTVP